MAHEHIPGTVVFVSLGNTPESIVTEKRWREILGALRHASINPTFIICGSRPQEIQYAEQAARTFHGATAHSRWAHVGNICERRAASQVMGDIASYLYHAQTRRKAVLVLDYGIGIAQQGSGLFKKHIRPGDFARYRVFDNQPPVLLSTSVR